MRVTNEQAISDKTCGLYCQDCDLALSKPEGWKCPHGETHVSKYAADLLEARELIKEMRGLANLIHEVTINPVLQSFKTGRKESIQACGKMSEKILEKSKEYAE